MRVIVFTPQFKRAFRKFTKRNPLRQSQIEDRLRKMELDLYAPALGTHKLSGELLGLRACSCGYDCRIAFAIEVDLKTGAEVIVLVGVGTHDEIY